MDLPVWQELRAELAQSGFEVVTVALDTGGVDAVRSWVERAAPEHPSLLDQAHVLDEKLGIVNVPEAVWVDEEGTIVRGPEVAYPRGGIGGGGGRRQQQAATQQPAQELAPRVVEMMEQVRRIKVPRGYPDAIRDWVAHGPASRYALSPDEVLRRSRPRPPEVAEAAACFEMGQHLWRTDRRDGAVRWFRDAHRLQPDNWTYRRQAWSLADPLQGPTDLYDGDWVSDVKKAGAENYYDRVPDLEYPD